MANYTGLEYMSTGGNLPPLLKTMSTGGNQPPSVQTMYPSNPLPPLEQQPITAPPVAASLPPGVVNPGEQFSAVNTTLGSLDQILGSESPYIQNSIRRGLETAANRGLLNSSIAAGAAQRGAIEGSMPILNQAMGLHDAREGRALQSTMQERQLAQARDMQYNDAALQDWMNSNQFNRQFNANLAMMPINNTYQFMQTIAQYGLENPEIYTPDVISGSANFFTRNMFDILSQYFPGSISGGTP